MVQYGPCPNCGGKVRPERDQPSPTVGDGRLRNMPGVGGTSTDTGGNPLQEGILADNGWQQARNRDESYASVRQADEEPNAEPAPDPNDWICRPCGYQWNDSMRPGFCPNCGVGGYTIDRVKDRFPWGGVPDYAKPNADQAKHPDPWMDNEPGAMTFPKEWQQYRSTAVMNVPMETVEVRKPSPSAVEAQHTVTLRLPHGITDNLHTALGRARAWVESPYENGQLRPYYNGYHTALRPALSGQSAIRVSVEDPNMAEMLNHVAQTDDLTPLQHEAGFLAPLAEGAGALGLKAAPTFVGALGAHGVAGMMGQIMGGGQQQQPPPQPVQDASYYSAYGDDVSTPSSKDPRQEDDGDPKQHRDGEEYFGEDDVNGIGGAATGDEHNHFDPKGVGAMHIQVLAPLLTHYFESGQDGSQDPLIQALHQTLDGEIPGYLERGDPQAAQALITALKGHKQANPLITPMPVTGPSLVQNVQPISPNGQQGGKCPNGHTITPGDKQCPQCGAMVSGTPNNMSQALAHQANTGPGPQTDEQKAAVAEILQATHRGEEVPNMLLHPEQYAKELAQIQNTEAPPEGDLNGAPPEQAVESTPPDAGMPVPPMQAPQQQMMSAIYRYGADSVANKCPKCDSHSTRLVTQDGDSQCHTCGHMFKTPLLHDDGHSTDMASTAALTASMLDFFWTPEQQEEYRKMQIPQGKPSPDLERIFPEHYRGLPPMKYQNTPAQEAQEATIDYIHGDPFTGPTPEEYEQRLEDAYREQVQQGVNPLDIPKPRIAAPDHGQLNDHHPNAMGVPAADALGPEDISREQDSGHTWMDGDGDPLKVGQEYAMYSNKYDIPDIIRVDEVKPSSLHYTLTGEYGLNGDTEVSHQEALLDGLTFKKVDPNADPTDPTPQQGTEQPTAPGEQDDLSQPHFMMSNRMAGKPPGPGEGCPFCYHLGKYGTLVKVPDNVETEIHCPECWQGWTSDKGLTKTLEGIYSLPETEHPLGDYTGNHTAGAKFTPMEQREFIEEQGFARNADKLNLEGTHYESSPNDYFLFGI